MKKYRPLNAGYILVYVVVIAVILQGIWTLIAMMLRQGAQTQNSVTGMLGHVDADPRSPSPLSMAITTGRRWSSFHLPRCASCARRWSIPRRARSALRSSSDRAAATMCSSAASSSSVSWPNTVMPKNLACGRRDKSGAKTDARLFPVHEVAFIMQDGRNCRMNAAIYKPAQLREMFTTIREATGIEPTGKLAEIMQAQEGAPA